MPNITVKNIPADIYEHLKESAGANHRSLNGEIIACLERAVGTHRIDVEAFLARAQQLREKVSGPPITDEELTNAKIAGRL